MAVTVEGGFPVVVGGSTIDTTAITQSVTVGAGGNRLLLVFAIFEVSSPSVSTATFGGVGLTAHGAVEDTNFTRIESWSLVAPATSTANVVVTPTGGLSGHWSIVIYVLDGVNQTTPFRTAANSHGTGTSASDTVSSVVTGDYTLDMLLVDSTGHTLVASGSNSVDFATQNFGAGTSEYRSSHLADSGGPMSWTWTTSAPFSHLAETIVADSPANAWYFPVRIPTRNVGPMALRHNFRQPVVFGNVTTAQIIDLVLTANATATATLQKQINKTLQASGSSSTTLQKQVNKTLSAAAPSSASLQKQVNKPLRADSTSATSLQKQVNKPLVASSAATAFLQKQINKTLRADVSATALLTQIKVVVLTLIANATASVSLQKQVNKPLRADSTATASAQKQINKTLVANATSTTTMTKLKVIVLTLVANATASVSLNKLVTKTLTASAPATATVQKTVFKPLTAFSTATASMTKNFIPFTVTTARRGRTIIMDFFNFG